MWVESEDKFRIIVRILACFIKGTSGSTKILIFTVIIIKTEVACGQILETTSFKATI